RSTCNDPVEVVRKALRFHQRFTATIGATIEIGECWYLPVERQGQCLGGEGGQMLGPVGKIRPSLPVPAKFATHARMPHVGGSDDEAAGRQSHATIGSTGSHLHAAAHATTAYLHVALGPRCNRQVNLNADAGCQRQFDLADGLAAFDELASG